MEPRISMFFLPPGVAETRVVLPLKHGLANALSSRGRMPSPSASFDLDSSSLARAPTWQHPLSPGSHAVAGVQPVSARRATKLFFFDEYVQRS